MQVFARAYNLLDAKNPVDVFTETGKADVSLFQGQAGFFLRPDFYSEPRRVQFGAKVSF